jgi:hypothetical protein
MENLESLELGILWRIASVLETMTGKSELHFLPLVPVNLKNVTYDYYRRDESEDIILSMD